MFFRTEEAHARSMVVDAADNLIVGTEPSGLIMRVTPAGGAGQGFVLYQSPKREITAVAVGADGTIYAAGTGNRTNTPVVAPAAVGAPPVPAPQTPPPPGTVQIVGPSPIPVALPILSSQAVAGGSEIYRIQSDGYPRRIWSDAQDLVYALAFDAQGRLLAGTGNHGNLYRIDSDYSYTRLLNVEPRQITGLLRAPEGRLYAVTGNIGKVIAIGRNWSLREFSKATFSTPAGFPIGAASARSQKIWQEQFSRLAPAMSAARSETGARGFLSIGAVWLPRPRASCNFARR